MDLNLGTSGIPRGHRFKSCPRYESREAVTNLS
nr:MAG TPA: hypothetical protein [Caudoviricetes sp.]